MIKIRKITHKILIDNSFITKYDLISVSVFIIVFFSVCFYGIDSIIENSESTLQLYFTWEKRIPFLKSAFLPYFGIFLLPACIPFFVNKRKDFYILAFRLVVAISVASLLFLIMPCRIGYPSRNLSVETEDFIKKIAGTHNLVPSLHVTLTLIICYSFYLNVNGVGKFIIWLIVILLPLSTLFTHQHHVLDVIMGILLSVLCIKYVKN